MNYGKRAEIAKKRKRRVQAAVGAAVAVAVAGLVVFSCFVPPETWKYRVSKPKTTKRQEGECRLHFLDVGQGDSILIELPDGKTMLVDGGDADPAHTTYILRYIYSLGIKTLDYLVATHSDADHTGGLDKVTEIVGASTVYLPYVTYTAGKEYDEFIAAVEEKGCETEISERGISLSSDTGEYPYTLWFLSPHGVDNPAGEYAKANDKNGDTAEAINDTSAVIWLDYSGSSALLCGDITSEEEKSLLNEAEEGLLRFGEKNFSFGGTEILKVAHHGSKSSSSAEFLATLGVRDAVICVGEENAYGHPAKETCERLVAAGAEIWRTDEDGTIVVTMKTDGKYEIRASK